MAVEVKSTKITDTQFREIMSSVPSAVTVVTTTNNDGQPAGMSAISFCSVSLDPPLILVCIDKSSRTLPVVEVAGRFAVNFLGADHQDIAATFASKAEDKFAGLQWHPGNATAQPLLDDAVAHVECTVWEMIDAGDHWIVIGHVEDGTLASSSSSLVYWRRQFLQMNQDHDS